MKMFIWKGSDDKLKAEGRKIFLELKPETEYLVTIKQNRPIRSLSHNKYYWLILKAIGIHTGERDDRLHMLFKSMFNYEEFELPNGEIRRIPATTSDLDDSEFSKYVNQVKEFAQNEWGVVFLDRHDVDRMQEMDIENRYERIQG